MQNGDELSFTVGIFNANRHRHGVADDHHVTTGVHDTEHAVRTQEFTCHRQCVALGDPAEVEGKFLRREETGTSNNDRVREGFGERH